jgi:hypothetical protein
MGGGAPIDIHRRMQAVYGEKCVIASTVRRSVRKFQQEVGEASLCDQARSVRPVTATGYNPQTCQTSAKVKLEEIKCKSDYAQL